MASLSNDKGGKRRILFVDANRERRQIRLGKMSKENATTIKLRVERLVAAQVAGHVVDGDTAAWLSELPPVLYDKIAATSLVPERAEKKSVTLEEFLDSYIAMRSDVKSGTKLVYGHTRRCLIEFFGGNKQLREITEGEADEWRLYLKRESLSESTVRRRCGIAKQYFRFAVRRKLIPSNPFAELVAAVKANSSRFYFVTRAETQKVIGACPSAEWRLLFALSRYGGLRCPSEHLLLRWSDVDWEKERIPVSSPKTAHHEGKETRTIPLFPELRPYLAECRALAAKDAEWVITCRRSSNANLRTRLLKIIKKAGLKAWPKLVQNLRSTRETELAEQFPMHVVCEWLGNSQLVATKHYLQITDDHFERGARGVAESGAQVTQNDAQHPGEGGCIEGTCLAHRHCWDSYG
jgi:integrase